MISYIKGELAEILPDVIVVEANGIGYNIYVPGSVLGELPSVGSEVKIYTYMNVKEDECSLFGFLTRDDLAKEVGVSLATLKREISILRKNGYIGRGGSNKNGQWLLLKKICK